MSDARDWALTCVLGARDRTDNEEVRQGLLDAHRMLVAGQPTDEPTEADPHWAERVREATTEVLPAGEVVAFQRLIEVASPGSMQMLQLIVDSHEKLRALVGGRSTAPTRDELGQRLTDAQQHNETLRAERDEARAVVVEARDILDALIEWFGAPDWAGPDLPVELGRRIATLLGPRSAMDRVRAPWALLSRSAAEPPATIDGRDHTTDAQTVIAAYLRTADLPAMRGTWAAMCEDVAAEILSELRAAGLVYDGVAVEPKEHGDG